MTSKVKIKLAQKGKKEHREVSFLTNHNVKIVKMWINSYNWNKNKDDEDWKIADVSFAYEPNSINCSWDGIINKWMLERNT